MKLDDISPSIKALILDMDGVLWRANEVIGDLPAIFEAIAARRRRRPRCDLYHAALMVTVTPGRLTIEQAQIGRAHV